LTPTAQTGVGLPGNVVPIMKPERDDTVEMAIGPLIPNRSSLRFGSAESRCRRCRRGRPGPGEVYLRASACGVEVMVRPLGHLTVVVIGVCHESIITVN
jgi:hypothetical protein